MEVEGGEWRWREGDGRREGVRGRRRRTEGEVGRGMEGEREGREGEGVNH